MATLVEARRDGRLGDREAASLARHVLTCATCRAHERALDEVQALLRESAGPAPTPLEHQRGRLALLRAAAAPLPLSREPRSGRSRRSIGSTLRVLVTTLGVGLAAVFAVSASVAAARGGRGPVPLALRMPPPGLVAHTNVAKVRTETVVRGSDGARFERRTEGAVERVMLAEGTLDLAVRKLSGHERFLVATEDAEVEVRGTIFTVEAHRGHVARVEVEEGKVEVRYRGSVSLIAAGGAWRAPMVDGGAPIAPPPASPPPAAGSPVAVAVIGPAVVPTLDDAARGATRGAGPRAPRVVADPRVAGLDHGAEDRGQDTPAEDASSGDASKAFGAAVDTLGRGDYAAARSQLDAFQAAHPGDARADLAAFLTIVSLQRAGRTVEAKEAARRYLAQYPYGDRRAEAERVANTR